MKRTVFLAAMFACWMGTIAPQNRVSAQQAGVSFQVFYDELGAYGNWVDYPRFGYVWMPNGIPGFVPYATGGHWIMTDDGWTWASDYSWGWAPFHYGRWECDAAYGWIWIPDYEWGPGWVVWRRSPGFYGWAPLGFGVTVAAATAPGYAMPGERWMFVKEKNFLRVDIGLHLVARTKVVGIFNTSTVIVGTHRSGTRNIVYFAGPERLDIQRATRTTIVPVRIREAERPGARLVKGEYQLYRPAIEKRREGDRNIAPQRVTKLNEFKPAPERSAVRQQRVAAPRQGAERKAREAKPTREAKRERER